MLLENGNLPEGWNYRRILDDEELRKTLAKPRRIPRVIREEITEVLALELLHGFDIKDVRRFVSRYGAFYPIFSALKNTEKWASIKDIANRSEVASVIVLKSIVESVFNLLDDFPKLTTDLNATLDENTKRMLEEFARIIEETISLWGRGVSNKPPPESKEITEIIQVFQNKDTKNSMNAVIQGFFSIKISELMEEINESLDLLETLSLLFPGRLWDYSIIDLHKAYFKNIDHYSKLVEKNDDIKKIIEILGRIELEYGSKRLQISNFSTSEVYSSTISNDIQHVLPVELVKLKDDTLRTLFFAKFLESKLLTYQLRGKNWVGGPPTKKRKGPVIALVDTSGSMHGAPEIVAKAVILSITKKMLKEKRDVKVILFSSKDQTSEIDLTDTKKMSTEFLNFLSYSFGGGTDFNTALDAALKSLRENKWINGDLLFITDGLSALSDEKIIQEWNALKGQNDTRVFTIVVGNNSAGGLERISDFTSILSRTSEWDINSSPSNIIRLV